jgi:hypothetical protein
VWTPDEGSPDRVVDLREDWGEVRTADRTEEVLAQVGVRGLRLARPVAIT